MMMMIMISAPVTGRSSSSSVSVRDEDETIDIKCAVVDCELSSCPHSIPQVVRTSHALSQVNCIVSNSVHLISRRHNDIDSLLYDDENASMTRG